jgi:8-oxo-dGTP diphosphatase
MYSEVEEAWEVDEAWTRHDPVDALHVQVAVTLLTYNEGRLQVLMREHHEGPNTGCFVLPHQIMRDDQTLEELAQELCGEYALAGIKLEQTPALSFPRIDPRSRVMSVGFVGAVPHEALAWVAGSNDVVLIDIEMEGDTAMLSFGGMPTRTGYFHDDVVSLAVEGLQKGLDYSPMPFSLLGEPFTYAELGALHEAISGETITLQWLRRKMSMRVFPGNMMIVGTGVQRRDVMGKPAELFRLTYVDPAERKNAGKGQLSRKMPAKRAIR